MGEFLLTPRSVSRPWETEHMSLQSKLIFDGTNRRPWRISWITECMSFEKLGSTFHVPFALTKKLFVFVMRTALNNLYCIVFNSINNAVTRVNSSAPVFR